MDKPTILNVCGGKIFPDRSKYNSSFLLNIDQMYFINNPISDILSCHNNFLHNKRDNYTFFLNHDIYDFLERYELKFDLVLIYRFMEHVPLSKLLYFIYLLSTVVEKNGKVDIIVPDASNLAKRILEEKVNSKNFQAEDIITTTEMLNEPPNPHSSLWTIQRAKYYFELEGRFVVDNFETPFEFDGRNIYLKFIARRV